MPELKNYENLKKLRDKFKANENGEIFDESIKENIDNVTIMTTINNSKNNTINLNLNNEKIEVFSENKCEVSNDTTLHEVLDIVKNGQQYLKIKKPIPKVALAKVPIQKQPKRTGESN